MKSSLRRSATESRSRSIYLRASLDFRPLLVVREFFLSPCIPLISKVGLRLNVTLTLYLWSLVDESESCILSPSGFVAVILNLLGILLRSRKHRDLWTGWQTSHRTVETSSTKYTLLYCPMLQPLKMIEINDMFFFFHPRWTTTTLWVFKDCVGIEFVRKEDDNVTENSESELSRRGESEYTGKMKTTWKGEVKRELSRNDKIPGQTDLRLETQGVLKSEMWYWTQRIHGRVRIAYRWRSF